MTSITGRYEINGQIFDIDALKQMCTLPEKAFQRIKNATIQRDSMGEPAIYVDNGSNILAVAHLDIARGLDRNPFDCYMAYLIADPDKKIFPGVFNQNLDDRMGVYIILNHLPRMLGVRFDWLLTTNEESGGSTAMAFELPKDKKYNWMVEFDRRGTDVVLYGYDTSDFRNLIGKYATVGSGSVSDISYLEHLGIKASNWGVGYHLEHSTGHYANLNETADMLNRFIRFYNDYKDVHLPHVEVPRVYASRRYEQWDNTFGGWTDPSTGITYSNTAGKCVSCGDSTYSLIYDDISRTQIRVCYACTKQHYSDKKPKSNNRHSNKSHVLHCENCYKVYPVLYLNSERKELCYRCFYGIKTVTCKQCFEDVEQVYRYHGVDLCQDCITGYINTQEKDNGTSTTTAITTIPKS